MIKKNNKNNISKNYKSTKFLINRVFLELNIYAFEILLKIYNNLINNIINRNFNFI